MPKAKKTKLLTDYNPDEVSIVGRGANKKTAYLIKGEDGTMPGLQEVLKDFKFANEEKSMESLNALCKEGEMNENAKTALATAMAILESAKADIPSYVSFSVSEDHVSVSVYKAEEKEVVPEVVAEVEVEVEKAEVEVLEVESIPVEKSEAYLAKEAENAILKDKILKMEEQETVNTFIKKAETDFPLVGKSEEIGPVLKKCSESLSEDEYKEITRIMKSAQAIMSESEVLKEFGTSQGEEALEGEAKVDKEAQVLVDQAVKKGESLSIEKARILARTEIRKQEKQEQGVV